MATKMPPSDASNCLLHSACDVSDGGIYIYLTKIARSDGSNCLIHSACDVSDGGIFVALAKASLGNAIGFQSEPDNRSAEDFKADAFWAEDSSTVVVSCSP